MLKKQFIIGIALVACVILVGYIDYITGYEFDILIFYFIPIGISAWFLNRRLSILITLLCTLAWYFASVLSYEYSIRWLLYWNTAIRLVAFLVVCFMLLYIRTRFDKEKQLNLEISKQLFDRKQAEEKVREQVDFLQTLFDTIPNPVFHKDANGRYTGCNRAFLESTGRPMEEVLGKTVYDMGSREIADKYEEKDRELFEHPGKQHYEWQVRNKLGEVRQVIFDKATLLDAHGAVSGLIGVISDITERKGAEEELRVSEERLRAITESAQDAILMMDSKGIISYWNPAATRMLGFTREEAIGHNLHRLIAPERFHAAHHAAFPKFMETGRGEAVGKTLELVARRKDGEEIPVELSLSAFFMNGWQAVGLLRDITDRKRGEAERARLEAENRQLQKAESLGRMAGSIAHIFNNQLAVVLGNLELALMDLSEDDIIRSNLIEAMRAARRSADVSGLMLTYLGQNVGIPEPLDLLEVCSQNLPMLRDTMPEGIILKTDLLSPGSVARANAGQLQQVLTNLITNGWESIGHSDGTVTLATRIIPISEIPKSHLWPMGWKPAEESFACLEVTDTGCGIAEDDLDKIFDPFYTTKFAGRGLGLAVVLGIVNAWGGAISVESKKDRGSIFRVFLPLVTDAVPLPTEKVTEAHQIELGGTVLLVDDQDTVRKMAESMLKRLGFEVLAASGGAEAVNLLLDNPDVIRCVITDLTMPGMDGWQTLAALQEIRPHIPVIVVSGHDEAHVKTGNYSRQPHVFLHKPYSKAELLAAIDTALKRPVHTE